MTIDEQLRAVVEAGQLDEYAALYTPEAQLDAELPGRTVRRHGAAAIAAELSGWWDGSGHIDSWEVTPSAGGVRVDLERSVTDGVVTRRDRQLHYLHVGEHGVERHVVFSARPSGDSRLEPVEPVPSFLRDARERGEFDHAEGFSGSWLERVVLADGTPAVVKHVSPRWDWIMRATRDTGREAQLWTDGVLADLPAGLESPVIAVEPEGDDGWAIAMRDVSSTLLPGDEPISRDQARRLLTAADALHRRFEGEQVSYACTLHDRLALFGPSVAVAERDGVDLVPKMAGLGWEVFAAQVDRDVASVVLRLADDPQPLVSELHAGGTTLIHGDFRHGNLGIDGDRVVALDWALAAQAPGDVEFLWYLDFGPFEVEASREQLIDDWRDVRGAGFDEYRFDLALLYEFVFHGWFFALGSVVSPNPDFRRAHSEALAWHVDRSRRALELWSPAWA